ncbi:hypothetical protein QE250_06745 [Chromatiaceae bacterium AAb-1]|nr:hypothetical protein [Chromatiaceae bacterium AAb-1]
MDKQFQVKLVIRRVPALAAIQWLKQAWQIFRQAPLCWIQMFAATAFVSLLGSLNPLLLIVGVLLSPFLTAGLYKAIVAVQQEQKVSFSWLFKPLQEAECRAILLRLAAMNMLASIPVSVLLQTLVQQKAAGELQAAAVFLFAALYILTLMIFAYSVAIAYFLKERRLFSILQASFIASWRNITALAVFGILSTGLALLTIPTALLGMIVVMPVLNIAFFLSFNDFFALQVKTQGDAVLEV